MKLQAAAPEVNNYGTLAFADRAYTAEGTLVPRTESGAVLQDPTLVAERVRRMVVDGELDAVDGSTLKVAAASVCVHGDSPAAVDMAVAIRALLESSDVEITPFT